MQSSGSWLWLAGIALGIAALGGAVWQRRRRARQVLAEDQWPDEIAETPVAGAQSAAPAPAAKPAIVPPTPAAAPAIQKPLPAISADQSAIALVLDPVRLSATLINTNLSYRLSVTNTGAAALSDVVVAGGMISAHASLPVEQQLATDGQMLDLLHQIDVLGPGETAELSGDLRLPLPQITPIRSGRALLFIPLARFRVETASETTRATFVIGETPPVAEAALLPFRIDMGPRIWSRVSPRRVDRPVAA